MSRRKARELALQALFQIDVTGTGMEQALEYVFTEFKVKAKDQEYCRELVQGTIAELDFLDEIIKKVSNEWDIKRMANVDRNILRMGIYEIVFRDDVPNNAAINEAIELGKEYSTAESGKFINGILGHLAKNIDHFSKAKPGV